MATKQQIDFSTYVERDLTKSVIDWSTISKTLSDDLIKLKEDRAAKKAEIEQNTIEADTILNTLEQYDNADLGSLALGMSKESAEFLRVQNDLFKRGLISQTEFAQAKQRVLADWKQFSNVSKQWNDDYAEYVKRIDDGQASNLEQWLNEQNVAFGNLENIQGYVNPQTGRLSLVEVDPATGKPSDDPGKHVSMNTINTRFKTQYTKIDPIQYVKGTVTELGVLVKETLGDRQQVNSREGYGTLRNEEGFQEQMREQVRGLLTDKAVATLAGSPSIGAKYVYAGTPEAAEVNENTEDVVVMKIVNGRPVLDTDAVNNDKIKKKVEDLLYGQAMLQLDEKYEVRKGFEKLSSDVDRLVDEEILSSISTRELNERKVAVSEALKDNTIDATQAKILNDKLNTAIKEKQVNANIANINSLIDDRELSGQQRTQQMLINADIQNRTLELKEKVNKEAEKANIVPYTYRDDGAVAQYGDFEGTGSAYLDDKLGKNIKTSFTAADNIEALGVGAVPLLIGGPIGVAGALATALGVRVGQYINKDKLDDVTNTLSTYISGTMDPNLKEKLLQDGPFEVRFSLTNEGSLDPSKMIFDVGGQEFEFPPTEDGPAKDAAMKIIRTSGISTAGIKQWIDKFIIDPMTLAGIANQIADKEKIDGTGPISYTEFVVKFGDMAANQEEYRKYQEDPDNYVPPVSQEEEVVVEGDNVFEQ
tara:strand:- start:200 stop:2314 length:2115 start_codon:yes stop_codon:yes gene_type:complete